MAATDQLYIFVGAKTQSQKLLLMSFHAYVIPAETLLR